MVLLLGMVLALPTTTTGWITASVLGGVVLLLGLGCCCCNCCCEEPCACDCSGYACPDCCDGDGCCDGGAGGGGCVEGAPPEVGPAAAALPLLVPATRRLPPHWLSHHPDTADYDQDTYRIAGMRWCIGCFTTYPLFLASAWLALAAPGGAWWAWLGGGTTLASLQAVSSAGRARRRWHKALVKTGLGLGLAFAVHGVLVAPWGTAEKQAALLGLVALAGLSAVPRAMRMRRNRA